MDENQRIAWALLDREAIPVNYTSERWYQLADRLVAALAQRYEDGWQVGSTDERKRLLVLAGVIIE